MECVFVIMEYVKNLDVISKELEECGVRILQVRVNFACNYRMPMDWNPDAYTTAEIYTEIFSQFRQKRKEI
jgi:hypothetical protein